MIVCPSLPTTGSHTLIDGLLGDKESHNFRAKKLGDLFIGDIVVRGHMTIDDRPWTEQYLGQPTIIALRHPLVAANTIELKGQSVTEFLEMYQYCIDTYGDIAYFVPLDAKNNVRKSAIDLINQDFNLNLSNQDIKPIKVQFNNDKLKHIDVTSLASQAEVLIFVTKNQVFLDRYYG